MVRLAPMCHVLYKVHRPFCRVYKCCKFLVHHSALTPSQVVSPLCSLLFHYLLTCCQLGLVPRPWRLLGIPLLEKELLQSHLLFPPMMRRSRQKRVKTSWWQGRVTFVVVCVSLPLFVIRVLVIAFVIWGGVSCVLLIFLAPHLRIMPRCVRVRPFGCLCECPFGVCNVFA